jgi:gluconate kinase
VSLYYINGTPGSGKSTIRDELARRGYETHDADDPDIGGPYNNATNQRVTYPQAPTEAWFAQHSWRLVPEVIQALQQRARHKTIFLCGTAANEDDVWQLFDHVIFLDIDQATLQKRIAARTGNTYGKAPHELTLILQKYKADRLKRTRPGVTVVNATLPLAQVVQAILQHVAGD